MKRYIYLLLSVLAVALVPSAADAACDNCGQAVKEFRKEHKQIRKDYGQTQKSENKKFRKTLKGTTGQNRASAIKEHRTEQKIENKAFNQQMHDERMDFVRQQLEANPNLTDAEKAEILKHRESQYDENVQMRYDMDDATKKVVQGIMNNTTMTPAQKKLAIDEFLKEQKTETGNHYRKQRTENKDYREKIRSGE